MLVLKGVGVGGFCLFVYYYCGIDVACTKIHYLVRALLGFGVGFLYLFTYLFF